MDSGAVQWEGTMWLRKRYAGKEGYQDFAEFICLHG
jgi:hypothetical protein